MISQGSQKMTKKTQINPPLDTPLVQSRALVQKIHPKTDCRLISLLIPGPGSGGLRRPTFVGKTAARGATVSKAEEGGRG